jgi:outer membrane protein TolC
MSMQKTSFTRRLTFWALAGLSVAPATPAFALQPLSAFVASATRNNPDNHEAKATSQQRDAQRDAARAAQLPSFTAQGAYTRNQYPAEFSQPGGQKVVITPQNGYDAYLTLSVPLVDVGAWQQRSAAQANAVAAAAAQASTELAVESSVTQAYYQLLGWEAVLSAAQQSIAAASSNLALVHDRKEAGAATELDLQRAAADLARVEQEIAAADEGVVSARRALESLSRLTPEPATPENYLEDELGEERPLEHWLGSSSDRLVAVRAAVAATEAAERTRAATRAQWLPTLAAQGQERVTNAIGFIGRNSSYTISATLTWRLDFGLAPRVAVQEAGVAAAEAREDKARRAAEDSIYRAWHQVRTGVAKARAARAQLKAASSAQDLARDRYANGVSTQLEVVQSQRDFFAAAVARAQADFDLQCARVLLRLHSARTDEFAPSR